MEPETLEIIAITVAAVVLVRLLLFFLLSGCSAARMGQTIRVSWRVLRDRAFASKVQDLLKPPPPAPPPKPDGSPLRVLNLLQREGRLLDFLLEDVQAYANEDIGAAVRDIHRKCRQALQEHLVLEPVLAQKEDEPVTVPAGFDPAAIRLTGNVTGQPPFQGTLRHHGWRVKQIKLAKPSEGQDEFVVQPAEVELS